MSEGGVSCWSAFNCVTDLETEIRSQRKIKEPFRLQFMDTSGGSVSDVFFFWKMANVLMAVFSRQAHQNAEKKQKLPTIVINK